MKITVFIIAIIATTGIYSQQLSQHSQYLRNQYIINPGAAGVYDFTDVTVSGRQQWKDVVNAPLTSYFSISAPLTKRVKEIYNPSLRVSHGPVKNPEINTGKFKHALGGQFFVDQYGAFRKVECSGTYAIHLPLTKSHTLSFGTKLGISNNQFIPERALVLNSINDNNYNTFISNQTNKNIVNLGMGFYLYSKKLFFGISADNLTRDLIATNVSSVNFNSMIHSKIIGGYKFDIGNDFTLTPSFLVKYMSPTPFSVDVSLQIEYKEWLWFATSYRHKDAVIAMCGLNISNRFKLGYSYDYTISRINTISTGGHEIVLGIMLGR